MKHKLTLILLIPFFMSCGDKTETFLWDLSSEKSLTYSYSQTVDASKTSKLNGNPEVSKMVAEGDLVVGINADETADLTMKDVKGISTGTTINGSPFEDAIDFPDRKLEGMNAEGDFKDAESDIVFDLLFPLPKKDLTKGEQDEIPSSYPFQAGTKNYDVTGSKKVDFVGFENFEGYNCAVLEVDIDISNLELPADDQEKYSSYTKGHGTYYFSFENGFFVGADIEFEMLVLVDLSSSKLMKTYMHLITNNVIKYRLKEVN